MNLLTDKLEFPDYSLADSHGLLAIGGDLSTERLKLAYKKGIFPWYNESEPVLWWFPDPRFVLFPEELKVSKSMKKIFRDKVFTITENRAFNQVITNCRHIYRPGQNGTWITDDIMAAYTELHKEGWAKSIEVWQDGELVGGLYGIDLGDVFCGESMFARVSNASKAGFIWFAQKYADKYKLIDCQIYTPHLESLGAKSISAQEFLEFLEKN